MPKGLKWTALNKRDRTIKQGLTKTTSEFEIPDRQFLRAIWEAKIAGRPTPRVPTKLNLLARLTIENTPGGVDAWFEAHSQTARWKAAEVRAAKSSKTKKNKDDKALKTSKQCGPSSPVRGHGVA